MLCNSEHICFTVSLLGTPSIKLGEVTIRLRSASAWAALAYLLVPDRGESFTPNGQPVSRKLLAGCIWDGCMEPLQALRQVLLSFRSSLGNAALLIDRSFVTAPAHSFCTDLQIIESLWTQAMGLPAAAHSERIHLLSQADLLIGGDFLETCSLAAPAARAWLDVMRSRTVSMLEKVLRLLYSSYLGVTNPHAAFEVLMRLCAICPDNETYKARLMVLGKHIDRPLLLEQLKATDPFEIMLPEVRRREIKGQKLAGRDALAFSTVLHSRIATLTLPMRNRLFALSVLNAPFNLALARAVCAVPQATLSALEKLHLLDKVNGDYRMLAAVQELCDEKVTPRVRKSVEAKRLKYCTDYLAAIWYGSPDSEYYFASRNEARVHLALAANNVAQLPASCETNAFYGLLRTCGEIDIATGLAPWAERVMHGFTTESAQMAQTAHIAGWICAERHDYSAAIEWLHRGLAVPGCYRDILYGLLEILVTSLHYSRQHSEALEASNRLEAIFEQDELPLAVANTIRFRAEIYLGLREPEAAMECLRKTEELYLPLAGVELGIANCRYWIAEILRWTCRLLWI